ncbi:hypothetical protein J4573_31230 [Actinomadura barringtoniae]|uniref:Uncharacterized protein n=1 Tax=Actinomadura barringtoniae TaxID=1427535 RepID=A0A939TCT8_9ACTN|nr:hypothetical protein [Actinomadura barringtoniae]MBO2451600.1 hypothetical protein [Actinomadura barringtoniae]
MTRPPESPLTPPSPPPPSPPPGPEGASSWPEFTARLRELYEWAGTPKYRALCSRVTGLSPAAVSTLIGKNPLSQPPETGTRRFVFGCLTYGGHPDPESELPRWTDHWRHLADAQQAPEPEITPPAPVAAPPTPVAAPPAPVAAPPAPAAAAAPEAVLTPPPPLEAVPEAIAAQNGSPVRHDPLDRSTQPVRRRRRSWRPGRTEVGLASSVLTATVMAIVGFTIQESSPDPTKNCVYVRGTIPDSNLNISWSGFYQCPNRVSAAVYQERSLNVVVGYAETDPGRFMCWARGRQHWGGNDIWYYTKADKGHKPSDKGGWGFMPASDVQTEEHPDPTVARQCHFI